MWFSSARKTRRTLPVRSARHAFHPRLELLEDRSVPSAGALDPTFGSGGMVTGPIDFGGAVVVQPADGKIVAGGDVPSGKSTSFALARFNTNGSVDSAFGTNGVVSTAVGKGYAAIAGLALQSNGAIVAAGGADSNTGHNFALARYTATGALDPSFGSGGIVVTALVAPGAKFALDYASAVAVYPNTGSSSDRIYVAGQCQNGFTRDFTLIRYNMNGTLDTTFGNRGIVVTPNFSSGLDTATALAIQPADGKIVLAGRVQTFSTVIHTFENAETAVARYLPNGTLDTTFNPGGHLSPGVAGVVTMAVPESCAATGAYGVVVQDSGTIVVSGYYGELTLARLTSTGQLDTTFGSSGTGFVLNPNMATGGTIVEDPNGDLLTGGTSPSANLAVAAYLPNGTPDTSFGTGGIAVANFSGGISPGNKGEAIAIEPGDGKIVAAGSINTNGNAALARFLPPNTKIGSLAASQATAGSPVNLTASDILESNPSATITQVAFYYLASNNNAVLLGYGTLNTSTGAWGLATSSLSSGTTYNVLALATDSNGAVSDPFSISFMVV